MAGCRGQAVVDGQSAIRPRVRKRVFHRCGPRGEIAERGGRIGKPLRRHSIADEALSPRGVVVLVRGQVLADDIVWLPQVPVRERLESVAGEVDTSTDRDEDADDQQTADPATAARGGSS